MKKFSILKTTLLALVLGLCGCADSVVGPGWITLIEGDKGLKNWIVVGDSNWCAEDGTIVAVQTPSFGKETAFFVSNNELAFSKQAKDHFHLYRLFAFRKQPKFFDLPGQLDLNCRLNPVSFRADFG